MVRINYWIFVGGKGKKSGLGEPHDKPFWSSWISHLKSFSMMVMWGRRKPGHIKGRLLWGTQWKRQKGFLPRLSPWPIKANQCVKPWEHCSYCRLPLTIVHNHGLHTHHIQFKSLWTGPLRRAKGGEAMGAGALSKLFNICVGMDSKVAQSWRRICFPAFHIFFFSTITTSLWFLYLVKINANGPNSKK